jgi:SpoVK/Ycf46/Vps4 family AAA+-type ATPase
VNIRRSDYQKVVENLRGLPRRYVVQAAMRLAADGSFNESDITRVIQEKHALLKTGGVLEAVKSPATLDDIGGMETLKQWLRQRSAAFTPEGRERGLPAPRGVLLLGVQGGGKSLAAKAVASAWSRPLLRLDPGALYDRFVGESERRLRESLRQAEAMAPVVLWIDEIEKGFASAASQSVDGGLSKRMFGALLLWMQEREAPVFLVATANDIEALPPELLRKGRFDEIFFVDLPGDAARGEIFRIHLRKHKAAAEAFDLAALISESAGRSGAEIEQAVVSAQYSAFAASRAMTSDDVIAALRASPPLSVTMREKLGTLRSWARGRCVPAE